MILEGAAWRLEREQAPGTDGGDETSKSHQEPWCQSALPCRPAGLPTAAQVAYHDQMRKLWEDHVTWTRLAIVTFADGSPGFNATAARLLQNQTDIGNAIAPFYGTAAGQQLSALLHDHITIAVELLQDAKAGDTAAFDAAKIRWYANANQIADFQQPTRDSGPMPPCGPP